MKKNAIGLIIMQSYWALNVDERVGRFKEEAEKLGYQTEIFFFNKFFINFNHKKIRIFYNEKLINLEKFLFFIPIVNTHQHLGANTFFIYTLEQLGHNTINRLPAILRAKNKIKTSLLLSQTGVPVVPSAISFCETGLKPLFDFIKGDEFVCKLNYGSVGRGVAYINSKISLISVLELLNAEGIPPSSVVFQKFIKEAGGKDTRIIVVGKKVIVAMQRSAAGIDFRSNLCSGGVGKKIEIPEKIKKMAVKAAKTLGLDYAGVDIVNSKTGPLILEVNPNPGLKIEKITEVNVTRAILKYAIKKYSK